MIIFLNAYTFFGVELQRLGSTAAMAPFCRTYPDRPIVPLPTSCWWCGKISWRRDWQRRALPAAHANLGDVTGQANVWVALYFYSDTSVHYAEGAYVDDILLRKCSTGNCPAAAAAQNSSVLQRFPLRRSIEAP